MSTVCTPETLSQTLLLSEPVDPSVKWEQELTSPAPSQGQVGCGPSGWGSGKAKGHPSLTPTMVGGH